MSAGRIVRVACVSPVYLLLGLLAPGSDAGSGTIKATVPARNAVGPTAQNGCVHRLTASRSESPKFWVHIDVVHGSAAPSSQF